MECDDRVFATYNLLKHNSSGKDKDQVVNNSQTFADMLPHYTSVHIGRHTYKSLSKTKPNCDHLKSIQPGSCGKNAKKCTIMHF